MRCLKLEKLKNITLFNLDCMLITCKALIKCYCFHFISIESVTAERVSIFCGPDHCLQKEVTSAPYYYYPQLCSISLMKRKGEINYNGKNSDENVLAALFQKTATSKYLLIFISNCKKSVMEI